MTTLFQFTLCELEAVNGYRNRMASLPLPYAQVFQLVTVMYAVIAVAAVLFTRRLDKLSRCYGFSRAFAMFMTTVSLPSYI